jgi:hypothetical protein
VVGESHHVEHGVTWLWRCECGWSGAVTESGVVPRGTVRQALDAHAAAAEEGSVDAETDIDAASED